MILLDICISIFEFYIYTTFFKSIFIRKELYVNKKDCWYIIMFMSCFFMVTGVVFIRDIISSQPLALLLFTFAFLFCLSYMYRSKIKDRLFYSCILIILGVGSEIFVGMFFVNFLNSILPSVSNIDSDYIFGTVCSKMIFFLIIRIIALFQRKEKKTIPLGNWIVLALIPLISIYELHAVIQCATNTTLTNNNKPLLIVPGILILNIFTFILYDVVSNQYEQTMAREREISYLENTKKRTDVLIEHGMELAALAHDSQKHLSIISTLIENNNFENCLSYVKELGAKYNQSTTYKRILPENQTVNIILDTKIKEAVACGIKIDYDIGISQKIPVNETDLCIVLGNAFDNAIRACTEYSGDKKIYFEIVKTYNRLSITITNSSNPVIIEADGLCKTTKQDTIRHGIGLKNIREIVKSFNNGNMQLIYEDNLFTLKILLFL